MLRVALEASWGGDVSETLNAVVVNAGTSYALLAAVVGNIEARKSDS